MKAGDDVNLMEENARLRERVNELTERVINPPIVFQWDKRAVDQAYEAGRIAALNYAADEIEAEDPGHWAVAYLRRRTFRIEAQEKP